MQIKYKTIVTLFIFFQISLASDIIDLEVKCTKNDMYSCQKIGLLYKKQHEYKKANYYFNLVCDNNISDGCMSLAIYYDIKHRVYSSQALKYYLKACSLNNSHACNNLGNFYRYGKIVDKNNTKAIDIFEKAYCLNPRDKPFNNRASIIEEDKVSTHKKDQIDCITLKIDESMDTANQIDDISNYQ